MVRFLFLTVIFFLCFLSAESQTEQEILSTIEEAKELMNRDPVSSKPYIDRLDISFNSESYKPYLVAKYHMLLGIYYYRLAKMDSSLMFYDQALEYYQENDSTKQIAMANINKAMCYTYTGEYEKAIDLSLEALRGFEQENNLRGVSMCNNIIANVYFSKNKLDEAVKYTKRYLNIAIKINDTTEMASAYNNLGAIYQYSLKFDSANIYFNKAIGLARANGNLVNVTNHLQNMASNYLELEQTEKARQAYKEALSAAMEMKDTTSIGRINLNLGKLNTRVRNHDKALDHISKALQFFETLGNRDLERKALREMYHHYEAVGNYQKALEYYKVSDSLAEVMFNEESDRNIEELRTQYETEKKDRQIKLQNAEIAQKDLEIQRNYLLIGGLALLIIVASLIIYLRYMRIKQKQALELEKTRREMERKQNQSVIQSQERERRRFATDLHDGMGQL
ncbi:MAG TPA: tetratricopeptide repeat protein, partial [Bacteroidales bacterium]|nr:tetratricopeptide repeat protein [Bacteroidales bacterium]